MTDADAGTVTGDTVDVSNDSIYDFLADKRRRYALHHLKQRSEPVPVRELAEQVAAWENDKSIEALDSQERKRVYIALYQSHLPSLDEEGLVDYDDDAGEVTLSEEMSEVDVYMEVVPEEDVPWSLYYAGLSVANAIVLGLAWVDLSPFDMFPDIAWGAFVLLTFAVSAFAQLYFEQRMRFGDDGPPPELQRQH